MAQAVNQKCEQRLMKKMGLRALIRGRSARRLNWPRTPDTKAMEERLIECDAEVQKIHLLKISADFYGALPSDIALHNPELSQSALKRTTSTQAARTWHDSHTCL